MSQDNNILDIDTNENINVLEDATLDILTTDDGITNLVDFEHPQDPTELLKFIK